MAAPKNNLPPDSQPWARYVENRLRETEQTVANTQSVVKGAMKGVTAVTNLAEITNSRLGTMDATIESVGVTANGKNAVTRSTDPAPSGATAGTDGDLWQQYAGTQIIAQWIHDGTEYQASTLSHEVISSIDLGTATVGALTGAHIQTAASGARIELTAEHLRKYDASENIEVDMPVGGAATFSGNVVASALIGNDIATALTGPRVQLASGTETVLFEAEGVSANYSEAASIKMHSGIDGLNGEGSLIVSSLVVPYPEPSTLEGRSTVLTITPPVPYDSASPEPLVAGTRNGISMYASSTFDGTTLVDSFPPDIMIKGGYVRLSATEGEIVYNTVSRHWFVRPLFYGQFADSNVSLGQQFFRMMPIYRVADAVEKAELITAHGDIDPPIPIAAAAPIFAWQNDAAAGTQLQYTLDGTTWVPIGGGGVTAHSSLTGLSNDDHTQYHTDARGDARYYTKSQSDAALASKITGFSDPNADRIVFWDDSAGSWAALEASTGLVLSGTSLSVRQGSETQTGLLELATNAETITGTDSDRAVTPASLQAKVDTIGTWQAYTPSLAGVTLGTGSTVTGRYTKVGKTITASGRVVLGTGGAVTGNVTVGLPAAAGGTYNSIYSTLGVGMIADNSAGATQTVFMTIASSTTVLLRRTDGTAISPGNPWTWAAGDVFSWNITYECQ